VHVSLRLLHHNNAATLTWTLEATISINMFLSCLVKKPRRSQSNTITRFEILLNFQPRILLSLELVHRPWTWFKRHASRRKRPTSTWWLALPIGTLWNAHTIGVSSQLTVNIRGAPDMWWPWMWQFGWSELHLLRVLYRILPLYVVDALLYYLNLIWAIVHGIPEWRPPIRM
jgi:hypothetical protein